MAWVPAPVGAWAAARKANAERQPIGSIPHGTMSKHGVILAIDFDGTIVEHQFPEIGPLVPHSVATLREFARLGAKLMLWTVRSAGFLEDAVRVCRENDVPLWGVNVNPEQGKWSASPKAYAQLYIDDAALGCPLIKPPKGRPFVDWLAVRKIVLPMLQQA